MNASQPSETVHNLSPDEVRIVLATARYDKIKKLEWINRGRPEIVAVDHVELTAEEADKAIETAGKIKATKEYFDHLVAEKRQAQRDEAAKVVALWDAGYFFRVMKDRAYVAGFELIYNDQTQMLIKTICFRLSGDKRYESELGFSFGKGLILRGSPGLGKSWIPSLVADNPICSVQMVTLNEITETVRKTGEYNGLKFASFGLVYLDDLGTEETPVKYFGTEIHWFKTWYETFYATAKHKTFRLIISTNLSFQEIEDKYGFRIRDRMAETFDVLDISGTSLRRK